MRNLATLKHPARQHLPNKEESTEESHRKLQKLPPFATQMKEDLQKGECLTDEHTQLAQ